MVAVRLCASEPADTAFSMAVVYAGLGERERALAWLEKACDLRDEDMVLLNVEPRLDGLHSDRRFQDLLRRMNLKR